MESEVYKLVTNMGNELRSYLYSMACSIPYPPNKKVIPVIGKLFAFANIEDAQRACDKKESGGPMAYEIWKAIATGVEKAPLYIPSLNNPARDIEVVAEYWDIGFLGCGWPTPQGTVLCDSITLIERMVYAKE